MGLMASNEEEIVLRRRSTKKLKCGCYQPFQDSRYGLGRRLHNQMKAPNKLRCTGCGTERTI